MTGENTAPEELPKTPEEVRQDALKKLTEAQKKLNDVMKGEDAQKLDALKSQLANLDAPQDKETSELSKALKDGDFKAAQEALDKLKAAAEKGEEELGLEWQETPEDVRAYLNASEPATWEGLRATAARMVL